MRDQLKQTNETMKTSMSKPIVAMNDSMSQMMTYMEKLVDLMSKMIQTTTKMDDTMQTMNGSLISMKDVMDIMVKNTEYLAKKMDELAAVTKSSLNETNVTMRKMEKTTSGLCKGRNPQAADTRLKNFDAIRTEVAIKNKAAAATTFIDGLEFQNWGICSTDTLASRDILFKTGLEEFFARMDGITSSNDYAKALASSYNHPSEDSMRDTNFNAVAYSLDAVHDEQNRQVIAFNTSKAANEKIPVQTVLSLILEAYKDLKSNKPLKEWEKIVIANNATALRLLQARHNFYVAAVIGQMKTLAVPVTKISQIGKLTGRALLNGVSLEFTKLMGGATGTAWSTDISSLQTGELETLTGFLAKSLQTRSSLVAIGVKPVLDSELAPFVHNLSVTDDKRGNADLAKARTRFATYLKKVQTNL